MPRSDSVVYQSYGSVPQGGENVSLSDETIHNYVVGFMVDSDGTLAIEMNSGQTMTLVVKAGVQYVGNVNRFLSTGSSGITTVSIFY